MVELNCSNPIVDYEEDCEKMENPTITTKDVYSTPRVPDNEDEISTANTEDSLLSSRTSTETINSTEKKMPNCCPEPKGSKFGQSCGIIGGIFLVCMGLGLTVYKPYDIFLDLRIYMTPGLPPYEWWFDPPDEVLLKVYIFNVTNSNEFLSGIDKKIKVQEIGPIIYREKLIHKNPTFNDNGTFTYTANRTAVYLPDMNTIPLNATIVMPNLGVLLVPSFLWDSPLFIKMGVNIMMRSLRSHPFITTTVYKYLWNETDPILDTSQNIMPSWVPTKNMGILNRVYADFEDNVTVYVGPTFSHENFFLINKYDGSEYLPHYGEKCQNKVVNSSEGISYPQHLTKNDTIKYWRKTVGQVGDLYYSHGVSRYGVDAYRYDLTSSMYDRTYPADDDCFKGQPSLPNGISDISKCYFGMPFGTSFPHFLNAEEVVRNQVEGLEPDVKKHGSYVIIEPNTGIPLHGVARSQVNLVVKDMRGFNSKIQKFTNSIIPLAWMEYNQVGIPWYIQSLLYFVVVLVPVLQYLFIAFSFITGTVLTIHFTRKMRRRRNHLLKNKTLAFESEVFLKPS